MKKQKKYYLIYQITNNLNNKIYIGKHKTDNLDDDYFGSGKHLIYAQQKYGLENFTKTILFYCANEEEMNLLEKSVVTPEFCAREDVYNMMEGGFGGWDYVNQSGKNILTKELYSKGGKNVQKKIREKFGISFTAYIYSKMSDDEKKKYSQKISKSRKEFNRMHPGYFAKENNPMFNYEWSLEQKKKLSEKKQGKKNNRYGSKWYYNPITGESHSYLPNEKIPNGWIKGRKMKKFS